MCGRLVSHRPPEAMRVVFGTTGPLPEYAPNWNVAPTHEMMVVRRHPGTGERRLDLLRWGLVPAWTTDLKAARKPMNARSETAGGSGMFKAALAARRCIVPVDAFYEWRTDPDGKQPFAVARKDGAPMALAGLWEGWRSPEGEVVRTFCILTCPSNATVRHLHERMSVILESSAWATWLGEDAAAAHALLRPAGTDVLTFWPVNRAVNSVRNNGPALLEAVADPGAPPPSAPASSTCHPTRPT